LIPRRTTGTLTRGSESSHTHTRSIDTLLTCVLQVWFQPPRRLRSRSRALPRLAVQATHGPRLLPVPPLLWPLQALSLFYFSSLFFGTHVHRPWMFHQIRVYITPTLCDESAMVGRLLCQQTRPCVALGEMVDEIIDESYPIIFSVHIALFLFRGSWPGSAIPASLLVMECVQRVRQGPPGESSQSTCSPDLQ
jgi:hypothetical protein